MQSTRRQLLQHTVFLPVILSGPDFQFNAHRPGNVQEITAEHTFVLNSKKYGTSYIAGAKCQAEDKIHGWIYSVNGTRYGPANLCQVPEGAPIEWRYVEVDPQAISPASEATFLQEQQ